jgi:hypothetical protein
MLAPSSVTQRLAALRFFIKTLKRPWSVAETPYLKNGRRLPTLMSQEEISRLTNAAMLHLPSAPPIKAPGGMLTWNRKPMMEILKIPGLQSAELTERKNMQTIKVLYVGDSEVVVNWYLVGADVIEQSYFNDNGRWFRDAMATEPTVVVHHLTPHAVPTQFPTCLSDLRTYDVVIFSDVGYNSIIFYPGLAPPYVYPLGADRVGMVREFVEQGGGFLMVGGYLSFAGLNGIARWGAPPSKLFCRLPSRALTIVSKSFRGSDSIWSSRIISSWRGCLGRTPHGNYNGWRGWGS